MRYPLIQDSPYRVTEAFMEHAKTQGEGLKSTPKRTVPLGDSNFALQRRRDAKSDMKLRDGDLNLMEPLNLKLANGLSPAHPLECGSLKRVKSDAMCSQIQKMAENTTPPMKEQLQLSVSDLDDF